MYPKLTNELKATGISESIASVYEPASGEDKLV